MIRSRAEHRLTPRWLIRERAEAIRSQWTADEEIGRRLRHDNLGVWM